MIENPVSRRHRYRVASLALFVLVHGALIQVSLRAAPAPSASATDFRPGPVWLDSSFQPINARGGGLLFHQGNSYWYGENADGTSVGQSAFVFPVARWTNAFFFMADRWNKTILVDSRYLWLPLQFQDNQPLVEWVPRWNPSVFTSGTVPPDPARLAKKKGVGSWSGRGRANGLSEKVDVLACGWYYNWSARPDPNAKLIRAEFVPMIRSAKEVTEANLSRVQESGSLTLLGFNEPDVKNQADMTVELALELWPRLMSTGLRLGSPAPSKEGALPGSWLDLFVQGARERNYRLDFICVHYYCARYDDPQAAAAELKEYLTRVHQHYRLPVWLTEFALSNWQTPATSDQQRAYIKEAVPVLETLPFLERYAWFALPRFTGDNNALINAHLIGADTQMTEPGVAYRDAQ
jgi:hypothetical protein